MFYRRKIILALLQRFGGILPHTDFQKYLFLFNQSRKEPVYEFVPYKFGMFSFQSYADLRTMMKYGQTYDKNGRWLSNITDDDFSKIEKNDAELIENIFENFHQLKGSALIRYVYTHYPYYAIKSEIASLHLSKKELSSIKHARPSVSGTCLFTIGYEGSSVEHYMNLLIKNGVATLCDIRRNPVSMKYGFSKNRLRDISQKLGIDYVHIPELGIESSKRKMLKTETDYIALFEEYEREYLPTQIRSLENLRQIVEKRERIAITCFEREHTHCHRHKVACALQHLPDWNIPIAHL